MEENFRPPPPPTPSRTPPPLPTPLWGLVSRTELQTPPWAGAFFGGGGGGGHYCAALPLARTTGQYLRMLPCLIALRKLHKKSNKPAWGSLVE